MVEAGNIWFHHKIGTTYIGAKSEKLTDPYWAKGVVKIWLGCTDDMTLNEIEASKSLKSEITSIK